MGCSNSNFKRKFIAIYSYLRKQEKSQIHNEALHLRQLEKEEKTKLNVSKRKEIIKMKPEIHEIEMKKTIEKINETKSWFFGKIKKSIKLYGLIKKKRARAQINKIINEKEEVTTDTTDIKGS